ncbi:MAG: polyprenyl synthetase family protein [Sedimentisphaerales bacterium]|nr:polyprenyl synthetase family protein [Sedimentisphaerales bacterium]
MNSDAPQHAPWMEIRPFRAIDSQLKRVREYISQALLTAATSGELVPLYKHVCERNGKMIRPALVLLVGQCLGEILEEHLRVAAMVQMIHDATLLHDDVLDHGENRRGVPTVNCLWGNESAVLLGDFILSRVFKMAADRESAVARVLAQTAVRVCEGELRQVLQRRNWQLGEAEYIDIITDKSASFFSGCCRLGAMLLQTPQGQIEAASSYGLHAGIAFQIMDDVLDITGDEDRMGKRAQSDFDNSKPTLAVIHLLGTTNARDRETIHEMLKSPADSKCELAAMLARNGSVEYARQRACHYVDKAIEALEPLPAGEARDALAETARLMADRTT